MGPNLSIAERIVLAARLVLPYTILSILLFLEIVSSPYPFSEILEAPFFLMAIYFWSIYRPTLVPAWLVFLSGLLLDLLSGMPLGLKAALFLLVRTIIVDQRRFLLPQSFVSVWLGFVVVNLAFNSLQWIVFSLSVFHLIPLENLWSGFVLGCALFPLTSLVLHFALKILPSSDSSAKAGLGSQRKGIPL